LQPGELLASSSSFGRISKPAKVILMLGNAAIQMVNWHGALFAIAVEVSSSSGNDSPAEATRPIQWRQTKR
jgi:hypothetical protein